MANRSHGRVGLLGFASVGIAVLSAGPLALAAGPKATPPKPIAESARVELGRRLFFDPAASRSGMRSCADCHDPQHGYSDEVAISRDARGATPRRTQTLVDCVDSPTMDWLGAFKRIEDVVGARSETGQDTPKPAYYGGVITPSDPSLQFVSSAVPNSEIPLPHDVLAASGRYRGAFMAAYTESNPTPERIVGAISAYCRSIRSGESDYDRYAAGDKSALSDAAQRGLELFRGKAACVSCHTMDGKRATFSDYKFHQTGLPEVASVSAPVDALAASEVVALLRRVGVGRLPIPPVPSAPRSSAGPSVTVPVVSALLPVATPRGGFKTPTLRDVAQRGPFMHNGSLTTLEEVVRFFLSEPATGSDELMPNYAATDGEIADIVAFLQSLSSASRPGAPHVAWSLRATKTRLHFADADGKALASWPVVLAPAGDVIPGGPATSEQLHLVTDREGWVSFTPPGTTHVRMVLEGGLRPEGGCWIPDTCTEARLTIPICGTGHMRVTMPADAPVPETLELVHGGGTYFPDRKPARTFLRKEAVVEAGGLSIVLYSGAIRTDVLPNAVLLVPPGLTSDGKSALDVTMGPTSTVSVRLR